MLQLFLPKVDANDPNAHGLLLPPLNTDILHGDRREGRAIHKGGRGDQRGHLIGRTKGGLNTKLHAVTDAKSRPLRFFMTAGQVSDYTGAAALLGSLPAAEWLIADRGYDADWFRDALKDRAVRPAFRVGNRAAKSSATTSAATRGTTGSRSCSVD